MRRSQISLLAFAILLSVMALPTAAQQPGISLPPGGDNQKSVITQYMGLVSITVTYNSPDVTGPNGQSRKGQIWGQLVPWGLAPNNFGSATEMPWRAGANENTTVEVSHDVTVEGKRLPAGKYGLHSIPREQGPWTVIFSNNSTAWGSFFYDPSEDVLRVEATPEKAEFTEWLTYEFSDRKRDSTVLALHWEELKLTVRFAVPDLVTLYQDTIERELQSSPGFSWQSWNAAAQFLLTERENLEQALEWSEAAVSAPFVGQANFQTLSTQAFLQAMLGKTSEAEETLAAAINHPTANPGVIHQAGRTLLNNGANQMALSVFQQSYDKYQGAWPTTVGMMRAHSALGDLDKALEYGKKALEQAPDPLNQQNLEGLVKGLEEGKPVS